ncbi:MAG: hypothetical protein ACKOAS_02500 [Verrucomicrobiota bacterium]
MSRAALALFVLLFFIGPQNPAHALEPDQIAFAVPAPGRVTLAVFDKTGRPVRILHALDDEEKFQIGLNGLITRWDGLDNKGSRVAPGTYHIRGYLIGEAEVSGEAFHFNDWIADAESPSIESILDFDVLPDGDLILLAKTPETTVCSRVSASAGFRWSRETPDRQLLACTVEAAVLDDLSAFSLVDGKPLSDGQKNFTTSLLTADNSSLLAGTNSTLELLPWPPKPSGEKIPTPVPFSAIDLSQEILLGASPEGVWLSRARAPFTKISLPVSVRSVSLGQNETFWFAGEGMDPDQTPVVGQADFSGEILRALLTESGAPAPKKIRASKSTDGFVVLEESANLQRLRALSRDADGAWIIDWEKTIRRAPIFGFVDGEVAADVGDTPQLDSLRFRLEENPLTGEQQTINLHIATGPNGTRLVNEDGLPLLQISDRTGIRRTAIHRGKSPDSLRVLQGDGACVEEFLIGGLRHILPLNAGEIEIR